MTIVYVCTCPDSSPIKAGALLPTGGKERRILWFGSIPVAIPPSCQDMNTFALTLYKYEYNWVVKIRNTSVAVLRSQYTPWPSY